MSPNSMHPYNVDYFRHRPIRTNMATWQNSKMVTNMYNQTYGSKTEVQYLTCTKTKNKKQKNTCTFGMNRTLYFSLSYLRNIKCSTMSAILPRSPTHTHTYKVDFFSSKRLGNGNERVRCARCNIKWRKRKWWFFSYEHYR